LPTPDRRQATTASGQSYGRTGAVYELEPPGTDRSPSVTARVASTSALSAPDAGHSGAVNAILAPVNDPGQAVYDRQPAVTDSSAADNEPSSPVTEA